MFFRLHDPRQTGDRVVLALFITFFSLLPPAPRIVFYIGFAKMNLLILTVYGDNHATDKHYL